MHSVHMWVYDSKNRPFKGSLSCVHSSVKKLNYPFDFLCGQKFIVTSVYAFNFNEVKFENALIKEKTNPTFKICFII